MGANEVSEILRELAELKGEFKQFIKAHGEASSLRQQQLDEIGVKVTAIAEGGCAQREQHEAIAKDHEGRIREIKSWQDQMTGKVAVASVVSGGISGVIFGVIGAGLNYMFFHK